MKTMKVANYARPYTNTDQIEIGRRIREERLKHGLSMADLATAIGLKSSTQISRLEIGECMLSIDKLYGLAQVFRVSTDYLLFGDDYDQVYKEVIDRMDDLCLDQLEAVVSLLDTITVVKGSGVIA